MTSAELRMTDKAEPVPVTDILNRSYSLSTPHPVHLLIVSYNYNSSIMSNQEINDGEELWAVADLCLIPMGVADPSVGPQIAEVNVIQERTGVPSISLVVYLLCFRSYQCQRVLEKSGVEYTMHGYGTNIEGPVSDCQRINHTFARAPNCYFVHR
jgi:uncharacterized protein YqgV (UPF0045/DUF77 family)